MFDLDNRQTGDINLFDLDNKQKDIIGLTFVISKLICRTPYGTEMIKKIAPLSAGQAESAFDDIEKIVTTAQNDPQLFEELKNILEHFKNIRGIVSKLQGGILNEVEFFELKGFLLVLERVAGIISEGVTSEGIIPMEAALDMLDPKKQRIAPFSIADSYSGVLRTLRREKAHIEARIEAYIEAVAEKESLEQLMQKRLEIATREEDEELKVMEALSKKLRGYIPGLVANMDAIGRLDFNIAKADLAMEYGAIRPKAQAGRVVLKNMFNPLIKECRRVSLILKAGATIITGANMGGKSTSLKTAVLNVVLCRIGFYVFAEEAEIPPFDGVCLIAEDMQSIEGGLSTFGAEIKKLNGLIGRIKTGFMFAALDEFARGTNPEEGAAIVRAVATFMDDSESVCLMTTHYDGIDIGRHYQTGGLMPDFRMDYGLVEVKPGTPPPRDAFNICKMMGLDGEVLGLIEGEIRH